MTPDEARQICRYKRYKLRKHGVDVPKFKPGKPKSGPKPGHPDQRPNHHSKGIRERKRSRNVQIIRAHLAGLTTSQIAADMQISRGTVAGVVWRWLEANWRRMDARANYDTALEALRK